MAIAIIGAMDEEVNVIKEKMTDLKTIDVASVQLMKGTLNEREVILLKSGIGKVNAAMATTILIERFQPTFVINTGSAGGLSDQLEVGDIIIGEEIVQHDVDVTAFDYAYGQVPQLPERFQANKRLVKHVTEIIGKHKLRGKIGLITTSDTFMTDVTKINEVKERFPDALAAEMEGAAIAQVCYQYDIPFIVIRSLSDVAGKDSPVTFDEYLTVAAKNAATIIEELLNVLANDSN